MFAGGLAVVGGVRVGVGGGGHKANKALLLLRAEIFTAAVFLSYHCPRRGENAGETRNQVSRGEGFPPFCGFFLSRYFFIPFFLSLLFFLHFAIFYSPL
jgi:hypothetical protein